MPLFTFYTLGLGSFAQFELHILLYTSTLTICHRFVSLMPTVSLIVFSFLLEMVEGIGTATYRTATYTLLTQLYPDRKGLVAVSILSQEYITEFCSILLTVFSVYLQLDNHFITTLTLNIVIQQIA